MTQYAIDPERQALVRVITAPVAIVTSDVAMVQGVPNELRATLARALTILSEVLWRSYAGDASASVAEQLEADGQPRGAGTDGAEVL